MYAASVSRKMPHCFSLVLLFFLCLLSACANGPTTPAQTSAGSTVGPALPTSTVPTISLPNDGVAASIPLEPNPEIFVQGGSATQLTFVGMDTTNISTTTYALPYKKQGNKIYVEFGQALAPALEIHIPRQAQLTVTLTEGNVTVNNLQGPANITLTSGTIHLKNFTPHGTSILQTKSGTIDVTLAKDASCSLTAQTSFGTIVSGYPTLHEKRSGETDSATGSINHGAGTTLNLSVNYGSITIGPA